MNQEEHVLMEKKNYFFHLSLVNLTPLSVAATQCGLMTEVDGSMVNVCEVGEEGGTLLYRGTASLEREHVECIN